MGKNLKYAPNAVIKNFATADDVQFSDHPTATPEQQKDKIFAIANECRGGWYPVFFDAYSPSKLNGVIDNIKAGKVESIQVQYDRNESLAKQIILQIESQTNLKVTLMQSSPPESATVTYERNRVTLIIRSK